MTLHNPTTIKINLPLHNNWTIKDIIKNRFKDNFKDNFKDTLKDILEDKFKYGELSAQF